MTKEPEYVKIPAWYYEQLKQERDQMRVHLADLSGHYAHIVNKLSPVMSQVDGGSKPGWAEILKHIKPLFEAMQDGDIGSRLKEMSAILQQYSIPDDPQEIEGDTESDTAPDTENPDSE